MSLTSADAKKELWRRGFLKWKLDAVQQELYDLFYNSNHKVQTWLLSRRSGKTYTLCVLALEQCLKQPDSIVKFVSPTKNQVNNNVRHVIKKILEDCPRDLQPDFSSKDYIYYFTNGSEIQLAGTDNKHAEKIRGGDSHIAIVDEAGSCSELTNLVKSILLPTTLITNGKVILASTPPIEPDHEFLQFIEEADHRGSLITKTVYDNPRLKPKEIEELITELGGINSEAAQRELFCKIIYNAETKVIPEFTPEIEALIVKDWNRPSYFNTYEAMDIGFKDLSAILFGYYDFKADKVIIEDELIYKGPDFTIKKLVQDLELKESQLWTNKISGEVTKPILRVSDINYIVMQEIFNASGGQINFVATKKDDKSAAVNNLRTMIGSQKIIISPKCVTLIKHVKNAKWSRSQTKTEFARSPDDGHYDTLDALIYFARNIHYGKNPYPAHYGYDLRNTYIPGKPAIKELSYGTTNAYKKIFGMKKGK